MTGAGVVLLTTFLASTVEAIEMAIIVVGVGAPRGWRSTLSGAVAAFAGVGINALPPENIKRGLHGRSDGQYHGLALSFTRGFP